MKRIALALLLWLSVAPCWAINVCTETEDAIANGPYTNGDDITTSLQEAIDGYGSETEAGVPYDDPYIPWGTFNISTQINFPLRAGVSLRGQGAIGRSEYLNGAYRAQFSCLRWDGADAGTMFDIPSRDVRISDMIIRGDGTTGTADVGLLVRKTGAFGTGKMTFDRLYFFDFGKYGIQVSRDGDNNCDLISSRDCAFYNCEEGCWALMESQAMGFLIQANRINGGCPVAIYCEGGGKATFSNLFIGSPGCTVLKAVYTSGGFGVNNADFYFNNLMVDKVPSSTNPDFMLVDSNARAIDVTFNGGAQSMGSDYFDGQLVQVNGNSVIRFNGFRSNYYNMVGEAYNGVSPLFIFNDCPTLQDKNPRLQLSGDYAVRQRGCFDYDTNAFYQDYPAGPVNPQSVTTTGSGVGEVTSGYSEQVYGQQQTLVIDMQQVLSKYGKTIDDVTQAKVTLKDRLGNSDQLADYNRNSTDDTEVTYAMEDVTVADGSTESHLIVRAVIPYSDFGSDGLRQYTRTGRYVYYIGCGLTFSGLSGSFEPDSMTNGTVKYTTQRVD